MRYKKITRDGQKKPNRYNQATGAVPYRYDGQNDVLTRFDPNTNSYVPVGEGGQQNAIQPTRPTMPSTVPEGEVIKMPQASVTAQTVMRTTYVDRATAFNVKVRSYAFVMALVCAVAAVTLWDVPLLSWSLLLVFIASFGVVWSVANFFDVLTSPDGNTTIRTFVDSIIILREQRARLRRWDNE